MLYSAYTLGVLGKAATAMRTRGTCHAVKAPQRAASSWQPYRYHGWLLGLLCVLFALSLGAIWILPQTSSHYRPGPFYAVAMLTYLAVLVCVLVLDWRGFLTLHGHVDWSALSWHGRVGVVLLYVALWALVLSMPALYLAFAVRDTYVAWKTSPPPVQLKIAELEASLDMVPPTEGVCAQCHKPLQVGAEFCAFCGAATTPQPLVCPHCATVALPGSAFCPHCRARL